MVLDVESVRVRVIENAVIEDDVNDPGVGIVNTVSVAEIVNESVIESVIAREKEIVIGTENVIIVNHIQENVHAAGKENANVKEIVNIESEAEKKVQHVNQPGQE